MVINRYIKVAPVSQTIQNKREQFVEKQLDYDSVSNKLSQQGVIVDAAEVHAFCAVCFADACRLPTKNG